MPDTVLIRADEVIDDGSLMSQLGLGFIKTVLLVVRAEDKCEQDAARA